MKLPQTRQLQFFNLTVDKDRGIIYNSLDRGIARLVGRLLWEHRRCSHCMTTTTAESPSTVRISGGTENKKQRSKMCLTTDLTTYGFDSKNSISGCRVTVTHQFWELAQAGSTPVIPTKNQPKMRFFAPLSADFLFIISFYSPLRENPLTAEKRLVPHLQHKPLSFFRKPFLCLLRSKF